MSVDWSCSPVVYNLLWKISHLQANKQSLLVFVSPETKLFTNVFAFFLVNRAFFLFSFDIYII